MTLVARAPGKVNLCLFLGPLRPDGRHELVTVFQSVSLADEVAAGPGTADELSCPGVDGVNIVTQALAGLRARGWMGPPMRIAIDKRIPVAGGMGGGSADAAAVLRLAAALAPVSRGVLDELARSLGADVPSQLVPGLSLGSGAGDVVEPLEPRTAHTFVIVPQGFGLSTAEVYREADRLGLPRSSSDLAGLLREIRAGAEFAFVNDLEPAAISLRPGLEDVLEAVRDAGADHAMVSGSGPTVFGVFTGPDAPARAEAAAASLCKRYPGATSAASVSEEFGAPRGS